MDAGDLGVELEERARDGYVLRLGSADELAAELIRTILKSGKVRKDPRAGPVADPPLVTPDPRGIRIQGGRITGDLDLDGLPTDSKVGLRLTGCRLERVIRLRDGGLPWLILEGCVLPGLRASGAQIGELAVVNSRVEALSDQGGFLLERVNVTNDLRLDGTEIHCRWRREDGTQAAGVDLRGAKIGGTLSMVRCSVRLQPPIERPIPAVELGVAEIDGSLVLTGAQLHAESNPALDADLATIKGGVLLDDGFTARGAGGKATVSLDGAAISGRLKLDGATITCAAPPEPDNAECGAAISLASATVSGDLTARSARLMSSAGPALVAEHATVNGSAFGCRRRDERLLAVGVGHRGALCISGATITGALELRHSRLINYSGPALAADLLTVKGGVFLDHYFRARGAVRLWGASLSGQLSLELAVIRNSLGTDSQDRGYAAAVWLSTATIGGKLVLRNATLFSKEGAAIMADYVTVNGDAALCESGEQGLTARGNDPLGTICLAAATINGQLSLGGATLINNSVVSQRRNAEVLIDDAKISGHVTLSDIRRPSRARTPRDDARAAVSLVGASIGKHLRCAVGTPTHGPGLDARRATAGSLTVNVNSLPKEPRDDDLRRREEDGTPWLTLDGLTFTGMPTLVSTAPTPRRKGIGRLLGGWVDPQAERWKQVLKCGPYAPQPYLALASAYEAAGDDSSARSLMIAQRDDARKRGTIKFPGTLYQGVLKWLIGYGYRSIWAVYWLIGLLAATAVMALAFADAGIIVVPADPPSQPKAQACTFPGDIDYAINLAFPVITLSSTAPACDVPPDSNGVAVAVGWLIRFLAAALAGFYIAGLAGLTRSPPSS
jgi:hypothetical protein